jgi:hypothetical protein
MSATRAAAKAPRTAGQSRPKPTKPSLALAPPLSPAAPRAPFVVLVASLLVGGLAGLLFLHTALAEDSFRLHDLQVRSALLDNEQQTLEQSLALEASPKRLADRAQLLGMVHSENPAFIRLSDGRILGKPKAGVAPPPPPAPSPTSSAESSTDAAGDAGDKTKSDPKKAKKKNDPSQDKPSPDPAGQG